MPLLLAPQVVALAWLQLFGPVEHAAEAARARTRAGQPQSAVLAPAASSVCSACSTRRSCSSRCAPALRTLPQELIEAGLAGGARPLRVLRTIVLPLMTPPLVAGIALCFVSCLGNFGIPALLGIPGNYVVLPTLIYQRLAGLGPSVLSDVAVLSVLIGSDRGGRHRRAGRAPASARLSHPTPAAATARPFELRPLAACPSRSRCGLLARRRARRCRCCALVLTSLVPAVGVALDAATATLENFRFVLFEHAAARRAFRNSFGLSATAAIVIVADRRSARVFPGLAPIAALRVVERA